MFQRKTAKWNRNAWRGIGCFFDCWFYLNGVFCFGNRFQSFFGYFPGGGSSPESTPNKAGLESGALQTSDIALEETGTSTRQISQSIFSFSSGGMTYRPLKPIIMMD